MYKHRSPQKKNTDDILYGRHPVMEALEAGRPFDRLLIQKGMQADVAGKLRKLATDRDIPVQYVPIEKLNRVTRKNHQGVIGFVSLIPYYKVEDVLSQIYDKGEMPLFLLCDGITDVRNFGAMARSANCANVHAMVITSKGAAAINSEAMKASAGALETIPVCKVRFLDECIQFFKDNGLQIVATSLEGKGYIREIDFSIPTAIIMGAEDKGVSPKHLKMADQIAKIPIAKTFDSYNVSVATGILLYETLCQRMGGTSDIPV